MSDYIPEHLLVNVLVRLPFDSLIRSRCVSKSWRALIDSSYFIKMHFESSLQTNFHEEAKIITLHRMNKVYAFDLDQVGSSVTNVKELNYPLEISELGLGFLGSCNGLLCLLNLRTDDIVLWNPWIKKYFALPSPPFEYSISCRSSLGAKFGYDRVNDDYKVVKWIAYSDAADQNYVASSKRYELCVYSLKLNSWSKRGDFPFELPQLCFFSKDCAFLNGALHWFVSYPIRGFVKFILAFDLSSEEFQKIPCPIYREHSYNTNFGILNGCLSLLCVYSASERSSIDLWVMEEYGVEGSWTKLTSIEMPHTVSLLWPVTYSKKRRQVVLQIGWEKLMVYDIETNSISDVVICGEVTWVESCVCVGSLIRPC